MHKRVRFYIGANNKTGQLEDTKAIGILGREYSGFTVFKTKGVWMDKLEPSMVVEVIDNDSLEACKELACEVADKLKKVLQQESIMVTIDKVEEVLYV